MTHVTLNDGDPQSAGTGLAGISRVAVPGWTVATDGSRSRNSSVGITVPAGSRFDHVALTDGPVAATVRGIHPDIGVHVRQRGHLHDR